MKKLLITAGNGFVAKNLTEQLQNEYSIMAPKRQELDLTDTENVSQFIKKNNFDVVIHTATYDAVAKFSTKDPTKVLGNHLKMFFNVARCKDYFGKMIYFGSGAEFCREHWIPKMKEDYFDTYVPTDQYGFARYVITKYALANKNIYNLRLFGLFGKYDNWQTRLIPNVCCLAIYNMPIQIEQNKLYDFLYINDLVKITKWVIENNPNNNIYNTCTGKTIAFKTIAEEIMKVSEKNLKIKFLNEGFGAEYSGDNSLLISELKNINFTPFDEAIKEIYNWYNINKSCIDKKLLI